VRALPFAEQEGTDIVKIMADGGARLFPGGKATRTNLFGAASDAGILHFATHGDFPDQNAADAHALWLADERGKSEALTASDVRSLPLSAARLVVLSVCNGGLYRIGPSDEPYGLMPAFLEAGAPNVIGTLWPLDDEFGRDFMVEFYRHLPTLGVAGALRKTSEQFIKDDEYLRNWAGFVLVGSGRLEWF
jgi:CHAT domain-containing protein